MTKFQYREKSFSALRIAIDLQSEVTPTAFRAWPPCGRSGCDASALLEGQFVPLAIAVARMWAGAGWARLEAIARAGDVVRFPADSDLPDPAAAGTLGTLNGCRCLPGKR
jgi:hypothetical protein